MFLKPAIVALVCCMLIVSCAKQEPAKAPTLKSVQQELDIRGYASSTNIENTRTAVDTSLSILQATVVLQTKGQNKLASFEYDCAKDKMVWDMVNEGTDFGAIDVLSTETGVDGGGKWWGFITAGGKALVDVPAGSSAFKKEIRIGTETIETNATHAAEEAVRDAVRSKYPDRKDGIVGGMAYLTGVRIEPGAEGFALWFTYSVFVG